MTAYLLTKTTLVRILSKLRDPFALSFAALPRRSYPSGGIDMGGLHLLFEPHRRLEVLYFLSKIVVLVGEVTHQVGHAIG